MIQDNFIVKYTARSTKSEIHSVANYGKDDGTFVF